MLPHSGYIKRLVFQCTGLKFLIKEPLVDFDYTRIINVPFPLFTLVLIKSSLNYTQTLELGTINTIFNSLYHKGEHGIAEMNLVDPFYGSTRKKSNIFATYDFSFSETLPTLAFGGLKNISIESKDILNINTEFTNITKDKTFNINLIHLLPDDFIKVEEFFTYLFTFLIELDPL